MNCDTRYNLLINLGSVRAEVLIDLAAETEGTPRHAELVILAAELDGVIRLFSTTYPTTALKVPGAGAIEKARALLAKKS